jgi:type I restriction enzyme S subunit
MIENLKPYPETKDSGLPWLGEVPAHWQIRPAAGAFSPIRERNTGMKENTVLSLSYGRIVVKPAERLHGLVPESFETYQIVNPGDIVIRTTDLQNDKTSLRTGFVRDRGIITSAYLALSASAGVLPEFGYQFLNTWDISKAIYGYGSGLRQNLDFSDFRRMPVSVPPIAEQAAIARFLAWATNRLDSAMGAKRRIIALLQEQKQAIIHRAVTRGLDPSVPLKDSGIPWLGEIPEHWEVITIGAISELLQTGPFGSQLHQSDYVSGGIPIINPSHLSGGVIRHSSGVTITTEKAVALSRHRLRSNDILIARRGDLGRCAVATASEEGWICGTGSLLLRCKTSIIQPNFLQIVFSSRGMCQMLELSSIGATMANLNEGSVARQRIPLPPLAEQEEIVASIRISSDAENAAIIRLERDITLLREYRTRLITDVVTGKLDVRKVAAGLPEEVDNSETFEEGLGEGVSEGGFQDEAEADLDDA